MKLISEFNDQELNFITEGKDDEKKYVIERIETEGYTHVK